MFTFLVALLSYTDKSEGKKLIARHIIISAPVIPTQKRRLSTQERGGGALFLCFLCVTWGLGSVFNKGSFTL